MSDERSRSLKMSESNIKKTRLSPEMTFMFCIGELEAHAFGTATLQPKRGSCIYRARGYLQLCSNMQKCTPRFVQVWSTPRSARSARSAASDDSEFVTTLRKICNLV